MFLVDINKEPIGYANAFESIFWAEVLMLRYIMPALLVLVVSFNFDCKKNPTGPPIGNIDTTNNNFSWSIDTLGFQGIIHDVAIVNDTLVYAVGEIYSTDSIGHIDPVLYNLAVWNGTQWSIERQYYQGRLAPINTVFVQDEHNIWLDPWFHSDGLIIEERNIDSIFYGVGIRKMWGNSSNLYVVGTNGFIGYFNGTFWQKIPSVTALNIVDLWGMYDSSNGNWEILAVANKLGENYQNNIIKIQGSTAELISASPINYPLSTVWFIPDRHYYVAGSGIYEKNQIAESLWRNGLYEISQYYVSAIRGNSVNDVFAAGGASGELLHYNGARWNSFRQLISLSDGAFSTISVQGKRVIAGGASGPHAIVVLGKR